MPPAVSSQYKNVVVTAFDANGRLTEKSKVVGRIRSAVNETQNVLSVKGGASGIAVEGTFSGTSSAFYRKQQCTECRDYLFIGSDGQTKPQRPERFPGLWTGDRYLITGRDLDKGRCFYYQTDTVFADTPDVPVTPDTPGGSADAPADSAGTSGNLSTGILGTQASLYMCLALLGAALCGLAVYRKNSGQK